MGSSRNKKTKKSRCLSPKSSGGKKIWVSSTSFKRRGRSQNEEHTESGGVNEPSRKEMSDEELNGEQVEEVKKPQSNDDAFYLPSSMRYEILRMIFFRETPTHETYMQWDECKKSFYRKMCACFRVDHENLAKNLEDDGKDPWKKHKPSLRELMKNPPSREDPEYEEFEERMKSRKKRCGRMILTGPFEFGVYFAGKPKSIPRPLYRLVKKAVDIMNSTTKDQTEELTIVEEKIRFFCKYFHAHLPTGWNYDRDKASTLLDDYDPTVKPRDLMAGYIPIRTLETSNYDEESDLSPLEMVHVMGVIYSRRMPSIWALDWRTISFYCKLCSCFGIDYQRVDKATKSDVCLMKTAQKPPPHLFLA